MANEVAVIPSGGNIPAHLSALLAKHPSLLALNQEATDGLSRPALPTIIAQQGMFKTKIDGVEETIQIDVPGVGLMNAPKIIAILLRAKKATDRAYYAKAYSQGQEPTSPDCWSEDGVTPAASATNKQCTSCAGCPMNVWGTAKKQDGTPGAGKACSERKRLAIFANKKIFKFSIPPASLGNFVAYTNQLTSHGLAMPLVLTTISFNATEPTKLDFGYQGALNEAQANAILEMLDSPEVKAIVEASEYVVAAGSDAPAKQEAAEDPAAKAAADKKAKEEAAKAEKEAKAAAAKAEKKAKEEAEAAAAAAAQGAGSADGPSDDELAALLGI